MPGPPFPPAAKKPVPTPTPTPTPAPTAAGIPPGVRDAGASTIRVELAVDKESVRILCTTAWEIDDQKTLDLVAAHLPHVLWRGGDAYVSDPYRALVDISRAAAVLGWRPHHRWPGRGNVGA